MANQAAELAAFAKRQPLLVAGLAVGAFGIYRLAGGQFGIGTPVTDTAAAGDAVTPVPVSPSNSDPFGNGGSVLGGYDGYGDIGPSPTPAPIPTPGTTPGSGSTACGPMPLYAQPPGTRRVCVDGTWQDVPNGTPLPAPLPRPAPTPVGTNQPPTLWAANVSSAIRSVDPSGAKVAAAIKKTGTGYGTVIDISDLQNAMRRAGHNYGSVVDPSDVVWLLTWAAKH